ncbi:MAG: tRNA pseudouridine(13) synthase TruD [Myxococcales bacterium]|jgi:tRNA pseudouridine13 synthase|nr:tRNA pseudouridine(13) synthase TruD [Myxococcales bacterium]
MMMTTMTMTPPPIPAPSNDLPLLTAALPGTGGQLRVAPEDFEVEELPAYEPSGEGDHLFLWIEKRDRTTREVAQALARRLGISERDVGYAGLKDKRALTRQFFSVPGFPSADGWCERIAQALGALPGGVHPNEDPIERARRDLTDHGFRVVFHEHHSNKLKTGHLRGNRFRIRLREVHPDALERAQAIAAALAKSGLPNAFGPQRFGRDGQNARLGRGLVLGENRPELIRVRRDRFLRRLCVSAFQSLLFNRVLTERIAEGLFDQAIEGDLMKKLDTGGLFTSANAGEDTPRVARFEISPTGPIFGHRMMRPASSAWQREQRVLQSEGIELASFAPLKADGEGSRRPMRIPIALDVKADAEGELVLTFDLPKGAFATVLLREVMKGDVALPEELDAG